MSISKKLPKGAVAWAFYDWANTGYAMIGLALIFPRLYKSYWGASLSPDKQTFWFTMTVAVASLLVAVLAPVLGSVAELGGLRKRLLLRFAILGIIACATMTFVGEGLYLIASIVYIFGTVSFYCANIFFDSMLEVVSTKKNRHFISGFGFSFGYTAGFIILLVVSLVVANHEDLGFDSTLKASKALFAFAAIWWAVFTIPLIFRIKEAPKKDRPPVFSMARSGILETWHTFKDILQQRHILMFLAAYLFYIDGVNTIITTASNYGTTIGFSEKQIISAFFIVQVMGVPFALIFGFFGQKFGPRRLIFVAIIVYLGVTAYGSTITPEPVVILGFKLSQMFVLAALIGMCQGGVQALSRSYFTSIIPPGKNVAYFGFYSMIGKSAAVLGPALMGTTALIFNDPEDPLLSTRLGLGSISILFIIGAIFLTKAKPAAEAEKLARKFDN
ncbi:MFS transporter [Rubellicoccus peritrichatus]|uniref:MFS transporter n=1 Tax=Rubellicoccus peritrichatus TaxID=3080537 RepID=A0AAQ3QVT8_9BACT|nr:MFS transporter [Puniceicoccus sp. CR14]WOO41973.1 MFS transporter [Puniceicoccus sp. CR14]